MDNIAIVKRLASDQKFRKEFSACPCEALRVAGFVMGDEDLRKLETVDWVSTSRPGASFDGDDVLCCSVGY